MSSIFGGSKSKSEGTSYNKAYDTINQSMAPLLSNAASGANAYQSFLSGDSTGFNNYKANTGYDAMAEEGSRGITGNAAARGLLRSGGTGKALQSYGSNLNQQFAGNYLDRLMQQAGLGFSAASALTGAGNYSKETSTSKKKDGLGGFLGQFAGGIAASDRRLKKNIFKIAERPDGLNIYQYRYITDAGPYIGVMAQEVAELRPDALGPEVNGYMTVNYEVL